MLTSMGVTLQRVLDLYAGSGALGIEALSRGAISADFVERDAAACAVMRENLDRIGFAQRAHIYHVPVERSFSRLSGQYSVIFLDPPYMDKTVAGAMKALGATSLIGSATTVVYEHDRRNTPPDAVGPLCLILSRRHGDSVVSFYRVPDQKANAGMEDQP